MFELEMFPISSLKLNHRACGGNTIPRACSAEGLVASALAEKSSLDHSPRCSAPTLASGASFSLKATFPQ